MKKFSSLVVMSLTIFFCMVGVGRADQHDRLLPLLGNLAGWQAPSASGTSLASSQMKMVSATRIYSRADKSLAVNIMINSGPVLDTDLQESSSDNELIWGKVRQIDGFWVKSSYNKKSNSGGLIVYLDYNKEASGLLMVDYSKMSDEEVLQIIKKLDWKKLKKVVSTLL